MKRLLAIIPLLLALVIFSSCNTKLVSIEECEWKMSAVMSNNGNTVENANAYVIGTRGYIELLPVKVI